MIRKACFGQELEEDYGEKISSCLKRQRYLNLGISVTPKVHIVMSHVGEDCQRKAFGRAWDAPVSSQVRQFNMILALLGRTTNVI